MDYQDRFSLTVKNFGRRVVVVVQRGTVKCEENGRIKTVTISYPDGKTRKRKQG